MLNTLQGLFILVFFTCSKKVMERIIVVVEGEIWAFILRLLLLLLLLKLLLLLFLPFLLLFILFLLLLIRSIL